MLVWIIASAVAALAALFGERALRAYLLARKLMSAEMRQLPRIFPELVMPVIRLFGLGTELQHLMQYTTFRDGESTPVGRADGSLRRPFRVAMMGYYTSGQPVAVVSHAEDLKGLLDDARYPKFPDTYSLLEEMLGNGLVTSSGKLWLQQRKLCTPFFHFKALQYASPVIADEAAKLTALLRDSAGAELVPQDVFARTASAIIGRLAFEDIDTRMSAYFKEMNRVADRYIMGLLFAGRTLGPLLPTGWAFVSVRAKIRQAVKEAIRRRRAALIDEVVSDSAVVAAPRSLLSAMILARDPDTGAAMPEELIADEAITFAFAGNDTTSAALSWLCVELSRHADVQRRLQAEVDAQLDGEQATLDSVKRLPLVEGAVKETLRLHPPLPFLERLLPRDEVIGGVALPADTLLVLDLYNAATDPEHWERPLHFEPERWTRLDTAAGHPYAYLPFSAGPRNCIGRKFAMLEATVLAATVMQHFTVEPSLDAKRREPPTVFEGTAKPQNFACRFVPRVKKQ